MSQASPDSPPDGERSGGSVGSQIVPARHANELPGAEEFQAVCVGLQSARPSPRPFITLVTNLL